MWLWLTVALICWLSWGRCWLWLSVALICWLSWGRCWLWRWLSWGRCWLWLTVALICWLSWGRCWLWLTVALICWLSWGRCWLWLTVALICWLSWGRCWLWLTVALICWLSWGRCWLWHWYAGCPEVDADCDLLWHWYAGCPEVDVDCDLLWHWYAGCPEVDADCDLLWHWYAGCPEVDADCGPCGAGRSSRGSTCWCTAARCHSHTDCHNKHITSNNDAKLSSQDFPYLNLNILTCFWRNRKLYLHILSIADAEMARVVKIFPHGRQGHVYPMKSTPWLLINLTTKETGHQQPWLGFACFSQNTRILVSAPHGLSAMLPLNLPSNL